MDGKDIYERGKGKERGTKGTTGGMMKECARKTMLAGRSG